MQCRSLELARLWCSAAHPACLLIRSNTRPSVIIYPWIITAASILSPMSPITDSIYLGCQLPRLKSRNHFGLPSCNPCTQVPATSPGSTWKSRLRSYSLLTNSPTPHSQPMPPAPLAWTVAITSLLVLSFQVHVQVTGKVGR